MSLNNKAAESKYNISLPLNGSTGVLGNDSSESIPCHVETQLRIEITGVGPTNQIQIYGKIRSSNMWHYIATVTGAVTGIADISTYDFIRYLSTVSDGEGKLTASGFIFTDQSTTNSLLRSIDNKFEIAWDTISTTFPSTNQDLFTYLLSGISVQTVLVTYLDSTKKQIVTVNKTRL